MGGYASIYYDMRNKTGTGR